MQFDITGFLIFLCFILPGFLAQRARYSLAPRSLKPVSPVAEVGEFVLAGVWVHVFLVAAIKVYFSLFETEYLNALLSMLHYGSPSAFLGAYSTFLLAYLVVSLAVGYCFGFLQGWLIIRQPIRSWVAKRPLPRKILKALGVSGFLREDPVWYFVLKQNSAATMVFLEVEMKNAVGIYTGRLSSYGILDDSVKSKDFYLEDVYFRPDRSDSFVRLDCDGVLLNFEDASVIQVRKGEPEDFLEEQESPLIGGAP